MGLGGVVGDMGGIAYSIIVNDETEAGTNSAIQNLNKVEVQADKTTVSLKQIAAAFAALTAASATAVYASDRVINLERQTAHAAITQDVSTRAMYEYVQSLSNASDSQEEVGATMNYLTRAGVRMADDLSEVYETMAQISDATQTTSTAIAQELIPTFRSLGMNIEDIAKYADLLVYAQNTTLFDIDTWSMTMRRYGEDLLEYNVPLEDTIAIMARMSELGIPQRKIMTMFNEALKEMGGAAEIAKKGEEELLKIQEELNKAQTDGSNITRDYYEDLMSAGNDPAKVRQLTMAYNRRMRDQEEKISILQTEASAKQAEIDAAKSAPQKSLIEALAGTNPRLFSKESLTQGVADMKAKSAGATAAYAPAGEIVTGSEIANYNMDQLMQNTIGKNIDANLASTLVYARDISGAITTISSILAIMQGFSAVTAASTAATAVQSGAGAGLKAGMEGVLTGGTGALGGIGATGALSILGGLGLGLAGVGVMEATGITSLYGDITAGWGKRAEKQGVIEQWGGSVMDALTGDLENAYIADYLKTHNGALPPEYEWKNGSIVRRDLPYAGEFAEGGLVPGPSGQPVNATLHVGEGRWWCPGS
jgi:hypothetical protein